MSPDGVVKAHFVLSFVWFWLPLVWLQDFLVVLGVGVGWAWFGVVWLLG